MRRHRGRRWRASTRARGVWKAPAGLEAGLSGVQELKAKLTDGENGILNPLGVNCLRTFPASGHVVWGARTLRRRRRAGIGVEVRPRAAARRSSSRRACSAARSGSSSSRTTSRCGRRSASTSARSCTTSSAKGAFQGTTPQEAYLVKCDKETTTQTDINNGVVNILVGFAPLKPAEFVIIRIQQLAGQIET